MNEEINEYQQGAITMDMTTVMNKVFAWMFVGLTVTGIIAWIVSNSTFLINLVYGNIGIVFALLIAEVILVIVLSKNILSISYTTAIVGFIGYAALNGLTLSSIFLVYEITSIGKIFLLTAGLFGLFALIGYKTNINLSKIGSILLIGLVGVILISIVNMFIGSSMIDLTISIVAAVIFVGITAYDVQRIKEIYQSIGEESINNVAILGALELYLDFINLLLRLLRLFGKRK